MYICICVHISHVPAHCITSYTALVLAYHHDLGAAHTMVKPWDPLAHAVRWALVPPSLVPCVAHGMGLAHVRGVGINWQDKRCCKRQHVHVLVYTYIYIIYMCMSAQCVTICIYIICEPYAYTYIYIGISM